MDKPETLDTSEAIARWDEIIDRTEAGESFIISVDGIPKVRLEPIAHDKDRQAAEATQAQLPDGPDPGPDLFLGSIGAMPDAADELDQIVADAYRKRREETWRDIAVE